MSLAVGTILAGRYRVLARLGDGGMGTVYQAEDLRLPGRLWAIKELLDDPNEPPTERAAALARFDEEVALLARLSNPRIPGVVDRFGGRGGQYFVMDYIPGASLEQRQARAGGPLPERPVLGWGAAVCDVLAYIHAQRPPIILRDLKPANIMVTPEDEVRVIDFGIARTYKLGQRSNTENLGTMIYASPEHLGQTGQTDARSDIYSLGATLYHVLTNHEPLPMEAPLPGALRRLNPALSEGAERVVIRAMQLDPARRYQTAAEMAAALRAALGTASSTNTASSTAAPAARQAAARTAPPAPAARAPVPAPSATAASATSAAAARAGNAPHLAHMVGGVVCPRCGHLNRAGARFCARDGAPLPGAAPAPAARARPGVGSAANPGTTAASRGNAAPPRSPAPAASTASSRPGPRATTLPVPTITGTAELSARRGTEAFAAGRYLQAARHLESAIAQGRANYDTHLLLGRVYRQLGRPADAADQFERAARLRPTAEVYLQLGLAERERGNAAQAQVALTRARQLDPRDPHIAYQLGLACLDDGLLAQAEGELRAALQLRPDDAPSLLALGRVHFARRQWDDAEAAFRQAVAAAPDDGAAYLHLGNALMAQHKLPDAARAFERATHYAPDSVEAHLALGMSYHAQGKRRQARAALRRATDLDPQDKEAQRLLKQI